MINYVGILYQTPRILSSFRGHDILWLPMKKDVHPPYYPKAKIVCVCGANYTTGSTIEEIHVEICSACHPFFTGKQKLVDAARRVEKFQERSAKKTTTPVRGRTAKRATKQAARKLKLEEK